MSKWPALCGVALLGHQTCEGPPHSEQGKEGTNMRKQQLHMSSTFFPFERGGTTLQQLCLFASLH
jgi:hypothetical protein